MVVASIDYDTVLQIVHRWPPRQRFALIRDLLDSLKPEPVPTPMLQRALGLLATAQPPPSDKETEIWPNEHRIENMVHEYLGRHGNYRGISVLMIKIGQWEIEEEELDRQHLEAKQRGQEQLQTEPQARSVTYNQPKAEFVIELNSGVTVLLPAHLLQGLDHATPSALADVQLGPRSASLHWETLGISFSLTGLLAGVFGTRTWMQEMGRRGGSATSTAKAAAARLNGKKGGRPAKVALPAQTH